MTKEAYGHIVNEIIAKQKNCGIKIAGTKVKLSSLGLENCGTYVKSPS